MNTVSVVVPTYNQSKYVASCLDSLWFQTHPDMEIVVVDDGSTDDTARVIEEYLEGVEGDRTSFASRYDETKDQIERVHHDRYPKGGRKIRVVRHPENRGLAPALNTGFRACTGAYCTYVPSDDYCYPDMMAELAAALDAGADFAYADMLIVDERWRVVRRFSLPDYSFKASFQDWYLCGVAKLYRTALHERFGWYDESLLAHDHELFQRFALGGASFTHVAKPLMAVLDHDRGRQVEIHAPSNWNRLLEESKDLVRAARSASRD